MSPSASETPPAETRSRRSQCALVCAVLALVTVALYWPITHHPFVVFDDAQYISENPHVTSGLSATNLVWAFTTTEQANWHPLTWLSHQMDCALFGVNPGAHHFMNLLFHVANTLLLFVFLRSATGALWRSALVAALFAWHPMHVESVAWAAERKDVLCAFFWLLTMLAYLFYARGVMGGEPRGTAEPAGAPPGRQGRAGAYYFLALVFCACSLLSKPMAVTLPFALLLLDLWPLNRVGNAECGVRNWPRLVLEKIPFFALVAAASVATYLAQSGGGAVSGIAVSERLSNAALAYARYTGKLFWPADLAIVYPHPRHWPLALAFAALALLAVWTALCAYYWRLKPHLTMGWFWFLGTLVPTIGLVQVGAQSMADRYTYLPSIGLFVVVVWGAADFFSSRSSGRVLLPVAGGAVLLGCVAATSCQLALWRDSITLFRHAVEVTVDNYAAENVLGKAYEKAGNRLAAQTCYELCVKTEPRFPQGQFNLAMSLLAAGRTSEALDHLETAAALDRRDPDVQYDLGIYFSQHGSWTNAAVCFSNSVALRPQFPPGQLALGGALANLGRAAEAAPHLRLALRLNPDLVGAKTNLDRLLTEHPELR
jgi:tetratricopeptide (TPR) repeat protein